MTTCAYCPSPAVTTDSLGEHPICCACACEDDYTDEWRAEDYARREKLSLYHVYYVEVDEQVYETWYNEGRWTAVDLMDRPSEAEILILEVMK